MPGMAEPRVRVNLAGQMPLISLIVLCAATALLTDRFLSPLNLTNILVQSSIMAVIALGMTFVIVGGGFDLSVGSTAALSGCIAAMVMLEAGITAGVLAGIAAGVAGRARQRADHCLSQRESLHHDARHHGPGARRRVSHHGRCTGLRRVRLTRRVHRLRLRPLPRHPLPRLGAGGSAGGAVLRHACDPLWQARLCHRRGPRGRLSFRRAGAPCDSLDLCLVRGDWPASPGSCSRRGCNPASRPPASSTS